jgi:CspA family cold shock protein
MPLETGTVKWFSVDKGYGFIERDDGGDLFAHRTALANPELRKLEAGQRVEFKVEQSPKGPKAAEISLLGQGSTAEAPPSSRATGKASPPPKGAPELVSLDEQLERALGERFLHRR